MIGIATAVPIGSLPVDDPRRSRDWRAVINFQACAANALRGDILHNIHFLRRALRH